MSKMIMIVEDNPTLLDLYSVMLTEEGYQVQTYPSQNLSLEDLEVIKQVQPDLLIIDLMLGRKEKGWQLIQNLRQDSITASIPIILCSGNSRRIKELEKELKSLDVAVILKPFKVDEFLTTVAHALA